MRADRLLSIMLLLQARGRMSAETLAAQLEVSIRTIYRDLDALSTAGIPVYTQPGPNGGVFLDEHYRVSLNGLSLKEVRALFVAGQGSPLRDLGLAQAETHTLLKLFAALPSDHQSEVERMHQRFYIDTANWFQGMDSCTFLPMLQQAVWEDRLVQVYYQPVEAERGERTLEAVGLVAKANIWYLVGKIPETGEMRNFRVGRLQSVTLSDVHFQRDHAFDLAAYWLESCRQFEATSRRRYPQYTALLRVHPQTFWYFPGFLEGRYTEISTDEAGWRTMRVTFDSFEDARTRLLGLSIGVEVIDPLALHTAILEIAQAIVKRETLQD